MTDKKIAVITPTFLPYRGGMCVVAEQDARQLAALGHEVDVWVPGQETGGHDGYTVKSLRRWFKFGNASFVPEVFNACQNYDAVVLHYPFYGGAEAVSLSKRCGRFGKLILYYHMDTFGHGVVRLVSSVYSTLLRPWIINSADRILVTSFDYVQSSALRDLFLHDPSFFRELPPAVDVERFTPAAKSPELIARYGLNSENPIVVFVGGLDRAHYFKGVDVLLRALTIGGLKNVQAVIVGGGELLGEYRELAKQLKIESRVKFTGPVSDDELPAHHRLADVFVFPSVDRSEAFGIAALEALSSGVPVVATDLPGVRTVVRAGETGWLAKPGSVTALTARLTEILSNDRDRSSFGRAGRQMAVDEYAESRRIKKWEQIIGEL